MDTNFGSDLGYAATGAAEGAAIGGPIGAAIGGIGGLFAGLFGGEDPEEERQQRFNQLLAAYNQARTNTINRQSALTRGNIGESRQAAGERAAAMGKTGSAAEAYIKPAAQEAMDIGEKENADINNRYDMMTANATADFENRPIEPSAADYLLEAGGQAAQYAQGQKMIDVYKSGYGANKTPAPSFSMPTLPSQPSNAPSSSFTTPLGSAPVNQGSEAISGETLGEFNPDTFHTLAPTGMKKKKKPFGDDEDLSMFGDQQ